MEGRKAVKGQEKERGRRRWGDGDGETEKGRGEEENRRGDGEGRRVEGRGRAT